MMIVGGDFAGRTVELPQGEVIEVRLHENPTTGFHWSIAKRGEPACSLLRDIPGHGGGEMGKGGEHAWQFAAVQPGDGEIEIVYRRAWETGAPARVFKLRVRVSPAAR
jgi:inhibitor of cysteine peptidase